MQVSRLLKKAIFITLLGVGVGLAAVLGLYAYLSPQLPTIEGLSDVRLQVPLRVYSRDGSLLGEFGEKRRTPKRLDEIPLRLQQAFLAAEDDRFYEHPGVDYQGILRAVYNLIRTGERGQGGSTITMQLARNFYLSSEKTYTRKINEIFLALKIDEELSKEKILELYLNKIYLGKRSYGVAAAAQVYYGKSLDELTLAQMAMIAGLPKAPSSYNPIVNPERALERRDYVLSRMRNLSYIQKNEYRTALAEPISAEQHRKPIEVEAPYVNEMVRAEIVKQFGDEAYNRGLRVITTIEDRLQIAANDSIWSGLTQYDRRHGFRGAVKQVDLTDHDPDSYLELIQDVRMVGRLMPGLVLPTRRQGADVTDEVSVTDPEQVSVLLKNGAEVVIDWEGMSWAKPYITVNQQGAAPSTGQDIVTPGDVIYAYEEGGRWLLGQLPDVQGALVAVSPNDGAIKALNGGFDYYTSKFNRVVQAKRQAGSSFKPIIYSAALSKSYTPATLINDAPVVFEDAALEGEWRPENYSGKFYGPTRLRKALIKSRNLVSIRMLQSIGVDYATRFAERFGLDRNELPHDLSLALGSCELAPIQLSGVFSTIANGGYLVKPHIIRRIEDLDGHVLYEADPAVACVSCVLASKPRRVVEEEAIDIAEAVIDLDESIEKLPKQAERTLDERIAYQMDSMLKDVVNRGTGRKALALGRNDLAGKTGTTNDQRDAWFNGYNGTLVATAWVGFDDIRPLGRYETGSKAALPMWIDFMRVALEGVPESILSRPEGLVTVKINEETGEAATDLDKNTLFEIFREENAPEVRTGGGASIPLDGGEQAIPEQLF